MPLLTGDFPLKGVHPVCKDPDQRDQNIHMQNVHLCLFSLATPDVSRAVSRGYVTARVLIIIYSLCLHGPPKKNNTPQTNAASDKLVTLEKVEPQREDAVCAESESVCRGSKEGI